MPTDRPWTDDSGPQFRKRDEMHCEASISSARRQGFAGKTSMSACRHLRLSDRLVSQLYDPDRVELQGDSPPPKWLAVAKRAWPRFRSRKQGTKDRRWRCPERDCETVFWFEIGRMRRIRPYTADLLMLLVCIRRSMGVLTEVTSKAWSDHVVTEAEQQLIRDSRHSFTFTFKGQWQVVPCRR